MLRRSLFVLFLIALPGVVIFISPAARTSVLASAPNQALRVMTYNIHVGVGMDKQLDLPRIAAVINAQHPDLVGLQEVDRGVARTQRIDEIAELAKLTRMDYAFAFNLHYQGGQYGVAILSRFPIRATDFNDNPAGRAYQLMRYQFGDAWIESRGTDAGFSYPADQPAKRIDYIFLRAADRIRTRQAWTVNTLASDHIPVVADLEIGGS